MQIPEKLRILALEASNVKAIRAVAIKPETGQAVTITGDNGAGKTSVLDSVAYALGGTKLCPPEPIRSGEEEALIRVELTADDALPYFVVERKFTRSGKAGGSLRVMNADGARYPSPQTILDAIVGRLAFDPTDFQKFPPKKQVEMLLDMIGVDFEDLDMERIKIFDDRADLNKEIKRLGGLLASCPKLPDDLPETTITMDSMLAELEAAQAAENLGARLAQQALEAKTLALRVDAELRDALRRVEEAKTLLAQKEVAQREAEARNQTWVDAAEERTSVESVQTRMREAEAINQSIRDRDAKAQIESGLETTKAAAKVKTEALEDVDRRKRERLEAAAMPVPNLSVTADHVTLEGVPLQQASAAQQLRVSLAIGWALNPTLRVMFIRDGSLLDPKSLLIVKEAAEGHNGQLWIERVAAAADERAIIIEDGSIVTIAGAEEVATEAPTG
jgi:DNA repair exonuclease SbcCD ATPase subunit